MLIAHKTEYMCYNQTGDISTLEGTPLKLVLACNPKQVLAAAPHKTPTVRPPAPYHENYSS